MLAAPDTSTSTFDRQQETQLVYRAAAGDHDAFRELAAHYLPLVEATVERLIGSRRRGEVQDVVQDIAWKMYAALDRWDPARGASFSTWIYTLVRNFCFDVLKKRRLRTLSLTASTSDDHEAFDVEGPEPTPAEYATATELSQRVQEAIDSLPRDQRRVFDMRLHEDLDYREIALRLGLSLGTVKSRLARARDAIRRELEPFVAA